jgi:hypothetical protein
MKDVIAVFLATSAVVFPLALYQLIEIVCWIVTHLSITFSM